MVNAVLPRRGDWIQTRSGKKFYVLDPRIEDIDIHDIASGTSKNCRYAGQCAFFFSVAQHQVLCARCIDGPPIVKMCALLHDAAEAYLPDLPRPIKRMPEFAFYREAERGIMEKIAQRFLLPWPFHHDVKTIDRRMLATEAPVLMFNTEDWGSIEGIEPLTCKITSWTPQRAEREFLKMFYKLEAELKAA